MKGAIAGGSGQTVAAGEHAFRNGGNAVDAAIAATLMAGVAEPLLTGLGGSGMATIRFNGETFNCDFFADMPGLAHKGAAAARMEKVSINYGPTTQDFLVGPGSATVPGVPLGLWAMHDRFGTVPMSVLAEPAVQAAKRGVPVSAGFERVAELLWPILSRSETLRALFAPNGTLLKKGGIYRCPDLGRTIERFASDGAEHFRNGPAAQAFLSELGEESLISQEDFDSQKPRFTDALGAHYRGATLWIPGTPSAAGVGVAHTLASLEAMGDPGTPTAFDTIKRLETALTTTVDMRGKAFLRDLFTDGFGLSFMARVNALKLGTPGPSAGYTTHISTVDEARNAVSITHSLGETAGVVAGDSGVIVNNFLGEADVNPPFLRRPPGSRLVTMCCPSILELADGRIVALGSGGSSRIPTAVVHGTMYMVDHSWTVEQAVRGPRTHVEAQRLHVESDGRTEDTMAAVVRHNPNVVRFDGPNMFFGGLHAASVADDGFSGCGDARRSGAFGIVD
jgi:gamma-glutamyltranspeptidase/glutathione hydrolase